MCNTTIHAMGVEGYVCHRICARTQHLRSACRDVLIRTLELRSRPALGWNLSHRSFLQLCHICHICHFYMAIRRMQARLLSTWSTWTFSCQRSHRGLTLEVHQMLNLFIRVSIETADCDGVCSQTFCVKARFNVRPLVCLAYLGEGSLLDILER